MSIKISMCMKKVIHNKLSCKEYTWYALSDFLSHVDYLLRNENGFMLMYAFVYL